MYQVIIVAHVGDNLRTRYELVRMSYGYVLQWYEPVALGAQQMEREAGAERYDGLGDALRAFWVKVEADAHTSAALEAGVKAMKLYDAMIEGRQYLLYSNDPGSDMTARIRRLSGELQQHVYVTPDGLYSPGWDETTERAVLREFPDAVARVRRINAECRAMIAGVQVIGVSDAN